MTEARLARESFDPLQKAQYERTEQIIPAWLRSWEGLKAECDHRMSASERTVGHLLYGALKLAPFACDGDEAAQYLNCISFLRARWGTRTDDISYATRGFREGLKQVRDMSTKGKLANNLAWAYNVLGAPRMAQAIAAQTYALFPVGHPALSGAAHNLGIAWAAEGKYAEAEGAFLRVLSLTQDHTTKRAADAKNGVAVMRLCQLDLAEARLWLNQIPLDQRDGAGWILVALLAYLTGNHKPVSKLLDLGVSAIRLSFLTQQERLSLCLAYHLRAALAAVPSEKTKMDRLSSHFGGSMGRPEWLRDTCAMVDQKGVLM